MTPFNTIPQPVPMYTDLRYQYWNRRECRSARPTVFHLNDAIPFFLIKRETAPFEVFKLEFNNASGDVVDMGTVAVDIITVDGFDFIGPKHGVDLPEAIPTGEWWMRWEDNGGTVYYSERIDLVSCTDDLIEIRFGDTCMKLGAPFQGFRHGAVIGGRPTIVYHAFSFWIDRGHGQPKSETETEETDNGKTVDVMSVRTIKKYLVNELVPGYIVDCFNAMQYFSILVIHDPSTGLSVNGACKSVTGEWVKPGCMFNAQVEVQLDEEWRSECCDTSSLLPTSCGLDNQRVIPLAHTNADMGYVFDDIPPGTEVLIGRIDPDYTNEWNDHLGEIARRVGDAFEYEVPAVGSILLVQEDFSAMDNGDLYNYTDILYTVIEDEEADNGIAVVRFDQTPVVEVQDDFGTQLLVYADYSTDVMFDLDRFVRITVSTNIMLDHPSRVVVWQGTEQDLMDGVEVTNPYPGQQILVRLEFYKHGCNYGTSSFTVVEVCAEPMIEGLPVDAYLGFRVYASLTSEAIAALPVPPDGDFSQRVQTGYYNNSTGKFWKWNEDAGAFQEVNSVNFPGLGEQAVSFGENGFCFTSWNGTMSIFTTTPFETGEQYLLQITITGHTGGTGRWYIVTGPETLNFEVNGVFSKVVTSSVDLGQLYLEMLTPFTGCVKVQVYSLCE